MQKVQSTAIGVELYRITVTSSQIMKKARKVHVPEQTVYVVYWFSQQVFLWVAGSPWKFCQWKLTAFETETLNQLCSFISCSGSLVRPKVVRSVHYCPATKKTMERKYTDMTSLDAFPSNAIYPTKVGCLFFFVASSCYSLQMASVFFDSFSTSISLSCI